MSSSVLRSLLFVPGDSHRKIERSADSAADAVILDLEDSVHPAAKPDARLVVAEAMQKPMQKRRMVRINPLGTDEFGKDLEAINGTPPEAIVLPKCSSLSDIITVSNWLDAMGWSAGRVKLLPVATESARAIRNLMRSDWSHPRLIGLTWGAEDIAADIGALENRVDGAYTGVYCLARELCLLAAREAEVLALDTAFMDVRDLESCAKESAHSYSAGFDGKLAVHPAQIDVINRAFTPGEAQVDWAHRVLEALKRSGEGVAVLDGRMIDMPHQRSAEKILKSASLNRPPIPRN
jgi:citrate lyase subunit beta/citryl-CoA lyase